MREKKRKEEKGRDLKLISSFYFFIPSKKLIFCTFNIKLISMVFRIFFRISEKNQNFFLNFRKIRIFFWNFFSEMLKKIRIFFQNFFQKFWKIWIFFSEFFQNFFFQKWIPNGMLPVPLYLPQLEKVLELKNFLDQQVGMLGPHKLTKMKILKLN